MTSNNPSADQLQILIEAGLELIPLHQWDAIGQNGKPVGKAPMGSDWRNKPALTLDEATAHMAAGNNVGIRLPPWMLVVDADPRNYADNDKPLTRLADQFGDVPLDKTAQTITGGGGWHIFFRLPDDVAEAITKGERRVVNQLANFQGVEFKGYGRQVVAPGSIHPDTKKPYRLDDDTLNLEVMDIIDAPPQLVEAVVRGISQHSIIPGTQLYTPEQLQGSLNTIDVEKFRDQDKWLEFMMACHAATQGEGLDEFITWSTGDPMYAGHGSIIAYRWDTLDADKPDGITHLSFRKIVQDHGGTVPMDRDDFAEVDADEDTNSIKPESSLLHKLNDEYCTAMETGKFWVFSHEHDEALDRRVLVRIQPHHFRQNFANRQVLINNKPVELGDAWIKWAGRRSYDSVQFLPEHSPNEYTTPDGRTILNLWSGFNVDPQPGDWSLLDQLMREALTGSEVEYEYLMNWFAYTVQHPELPAGVATVFRGMKGIGKSTLGQMLNRIFGDHSLHIASKDLLTGRFNLHLRDCVALFADEAFFAGDKDGESRLKGLITERVLAFEGKGMNAVTGRNTLSVLMATNSDWAVPATKDERRYVVYDVKPIFKGNTQFFNALYRQLDDGGTAGFLHDLLDRDISEFHPERDAPKTSALAEQVKQSITDAHTWVIVEMIESGQVDAICQVETDGNLIVSKQGINALAKQAARERKGLSWSRSTNATKTIIEDILAGNLYGYRLHSSRPRFVDERICCYHLPPLDVMRDQLAHYLHCSLEALDVDKDVEQWETAVF